MKKNMFKKRLISDSENIFADFAKIRTAHGTSLKTLSRETKIPIKYLKYIEEGRKELLPDILYTKNIIKKYLTYFNIDFEQYIKNLVLEKSANSQMKKAISKKEMIVVPKIIKIIILSLTSLTFFIYLAYSIFQIFKPPTIQIYSPQNNIKVNSSVIEIKGKAEPESRMSINDQEVILKQDGSFSTEVNLQKGINLIKIIGIKRYSKENVLWRTVILEIN